jgi:hypothetical protein
MSVPESGFIYPDGGSLYYVDDGTATLYSIPRDPSDIGVSLTLDRGHLLAFEATVGTLVLVDTATGARTLGPQMHTASEALRCAAVNPASGDTVYMATSSAESGSTQLAAVLVDKTTLAASAIPIDGRGANACAFSPDGSVLTVGYRTTTSFGTLVYAPAQLVRQYMVADWSELSVPDADIRTALNLHTASDANKGVGLVGYSPDGQSVWAGGRNLRAAIFSAADWSVEHLDTFSNADDYAYRWNDDGSRMARLAADSGLSPRMFDVAGGVYTSDIGINARAFVPRCEFIPGTRNLVTTDYFNDYGLGTLMVVDSDTGVLVRGLDGYSDVFIPIPVGAPPPAPERFWTQRIRTQEII